MDLMEVNGTLSPANEKEWASSSGRMVLSMKATGDLEKLLEEAECFTTMEMCTRENGKMETFTDPEHTITMAMVPFSKETGSRKLVLDQV